MFGSKDKPVSVSGWRLLPISLKKRFFFLKKKPLGFSVFERDCGAGLKER
jgi:hypothetical protein